MADRVDPVLTSAGYLLLKAGTQFHGIIEDALQAIDVTPRQFLVLAFAGGDEPLSQTELSARLGLDPTIVLGVIDALENRGAIRRTRDPADRRRSLVEITAGGRRLHAKATAAVAAAEREFLAPLAGADRKALRRSLLEVMEHRLPWLAPSED
jgi:DNA-binding MarR family transcriptional regulator